MHPMSSYVSIRPACSSEVCLYWNEPERETRRASWEEKKKNKKTSEHGKDEISLIRTGRYKWGTLLPAQPASRKRVLPQSVLSLEDENLCFSPSVPSLWGSCVVRSEQTCHSSLFMLLSPLLPKVRSLLTWCSLKQSLERKLIGTVFEWKTAQMVLKFNVTGIFPVQRTYIYIIMKTLEPWPNSLNRGVHSNNASSYASCHFSYFLPSSVGFIFLSNFVKIKGKKEQEKTKSVPQGSLGNQARGMDTKCALLSNLRWCTLLCNTFM